VISLRGRFEGDGERAVAGRFHLRRFFLPGPKAYFHEQLQADREGGCLRQVWKATEMKRRLDFD